MSDTPILTCRGLSYAYNKKRTVIENLDLQLHAGRIVGLLGPNGCGKTTLIKLMAGLLTPVTWTIEVAGLPRDESSNSHIAYLPDHTKPFSIGLHRVEDCMREYASFFPDFDADYFHRWLADMKLSPRTETYSLSKGMTERLFLCLTLARRTSLYLLDEPFGGVDPVARDEILGTIIDACADDDRAAPAVLLSTHMVHDIEGMLDEVIFLGRGGQILLSGDADELRTSHGMTLDELYREVFKCSEAV